MFCVSVAVIISCSGVPSGNASNMRISSWMVYWDMDRGQQEYHKIGGKIQSISYFAAYFDERNQLFIPQELMTAQKNIKKEKTGTSYLTIVNDKKTGHGKNSLKDLDVLRGVFKDEYSLEHHVHDIIELAEKNNYNGIEIDYEQVWKDPELQKKFLHFLEILYTQSNQKGLKLRVDLEPATPFADPYPLGPQYVVMMYNLYGTHSGPGPKANEPFIVRVSQGMALLPGHTSAAFATGGCVWEDGNNGRLISEQDAVSLAEEQRAKPERDTASQCLHFEYMKEGHQYVVWYADRQTLNAWIHLMAVYGHTDVSIWRLGGNLQIERLNERGGGT